MKNLFQAHKTVLRFFTTKKILSIKSKFKINALKNYPKNFVLRYVFFYSEMFSFFLQLYSVDHTSKEPDHSQKLHTIEVPHDEFLTNV